MPFNRNFYHRARGLGRYGRYTRGRGGGSGGRRAGGRMRPFSGYSHTSSFSEPILSSITLLGHENYHTIYTAITPGVLVSFQAKGQLSMDGNSFSGTNEYITFGAVRVPAGTTAYQAYQNWRKPIVIAQEGISAYVNALILASKAGRETNQTNIGLITPDNISQYSYVPIPDIRNNIVQLFQSIIGKNITAAQQVIINQLAVALQSQNKNLGELRALVSRLVQDTQSPYTSSKDVIYFGSGQLITTEGYSQDSKIRVRFGIPAIKMKPGDAIVFVYKSIHIVNQQEDDQGNIIVPDAVPALSMNTSFQYIT